MIGIELETALRSGRGELLLYRHSRADGQGVVGFEILDTDVWRKVFTTSGEIVGYQTKNLPGGDMHLRASDVLRLLEHPQVATCEVDRYGRRVEGPR